MRRRGWNHGRSSESRPIAQRLAEELADAPASADERSFNEDLGELDSEILVAERKRLRAAIGLLPRHGPGPVWTGWAIERAALIDRELEARRIEAETERRHAR